MKHDLFLCHTGVDKDWTRELGRRLEEHRLSNRPIKVWFDEWDVDYGRSFVSAIDDGLKESRYVALVLSPAMVRADWPTAEWQSQIVDDPTGKSGRILPLLVSKIDDGGAPIELPFVLKALKRFDFTEPRKFDVVFDSLLRKLAGLPPVRGTPSSRRGGLGSALHSIPTSGQEAPDLVEESLSSNLLPVTELPNRLYSDATSIETKKEVWGRIKGTVPPFFLHERRLYSFVAPADSRNPFKPFLAGNAATAEDSTRWLSDPDRARNVVGLLNAGLRQHCYDLQIWKQKTDRGLFYPPIFDDAPARKFTWGQGRFRTLAVMKESTKDGGLPFGVHMAARMRFMLLGPTTYLVIEPAWMFTADGIKAVAGKDMGVFATKWGGREKNAAILRNVLMWGLLIAEGKREVVINLATKSSPALLKVQSVPAHTRIGVGIFGDKIRLDGILRGEGAGEQRTDDDAEGTAELNEIANLALLGDLSEEEDNPQGTFEPDEEDDGGELKLRP